MFVVLARAKKSYINSKSTVIKEKINEQIVSKVQNNILNQPLLVEYKLPSAIF